MYLVVDVRKGDIWLRETDAFHSFHVVADPRDAPDEEVVAVLGDEGAPASDGHIWVAVNAPRRLMGRKATEEWEEGYQEMLDHARDKGWMNASGTQVRAQIQR